MLRVLPKICRQTRRLGVAMVAIAALGISGCEDGESAPTITYQAPAAPGVCALGEDAPKIEVAPNIQAIGSASNELVHAEGYVWVVESTSNTVSRFDPETGHFDAHFVDVGDGRNPYNIAIDAAHARVYISNWIANSLSVADLHSGEILAEIDAETGQFDAPQGITLTQNYIYIANTAYRGPGDYGAGSVTILARDSLEFVGKNLTAERNPGFVQAIETPDGPGVVVVNTGALEVTNEGAFVRGISGIEVWTERADAPPSGPFYPLEPSDNPRMGAPGRAVLSETGTIIYFPSATAPVLFKFDLSAGQWLRGSANPILLHDKEKTASPQDGAFNATLDARGILYVSALNEDAVYLVDTACDEVLAGPIPVGTTDAQLEGPQDLAVIERDGETRVFFITTLSNAMGQITLDYRPD